MFVESRIAEGKRLSELLTECDELIAIFVTIIKITKNDN